MLKKVMEEDFLVLRGPLESGRQSPNSLAGTLLLFLFIQPLIFILTYVVAGDSTIYPNKAIIFTVHLWITATLIFLSIIYTIPVVYKKSQKIQYLLVILVSQNVAGACFYISALFLIGSENIGMDTPEASLMTFTYVTLLLGLLTFIATSLRFYILLRKGHYRRGSKKDELRRKLETNSYLPMVIIIGPLLFFTMLFVLPEQLVILYCKFRFDSFNYNKKGKLKPFNKQRKGAGK